MKKRQLFAILPLMFAGAAVQAGTADLSGLYEGEHQFVGFAQQGPFHNHMGHGAPYGQVGQLAEYMTWDWTWNMTSGGTAMVDGSSIAYDGLMTVSYDNPVVDFNGNEGDWVSMGAGFVLRYHNGDPARPDHSGDVAGIPIVDNGDGTYTGYIDLEIYNYIKPGPERGWIQTTWEVTDDGMGNLTMTTIDSDSNGYPGHMMYDMFPFPFEPTFNGSAVAVVPEPSTYALMLGGLGLVGLMARRRKQA